MTPLTDPPSSVWLNLTLDECSEMLNVIALPSNDNLDFSLFRSPPFGTMHSDDTDFSMPQYATDKSSYDELLDYALVGPDWFRVVGPLLYRNIYVSGSGTGRMTALARRLGRRIEPVALFRKRTKNSDNFKYSDVRAGTFVRRLHISSEFAYSEEYLHPILELMSVCTNLKFFKLHFHTISENATHSFHELLSRISADGLLSSARKVIFDCPYRHIPLIETQIRIPSWQYLSILVYKECYVRGETSALAGVSIHRMTLPLLHTLVCENGSNSTYLVLSQVNMPRLVHVSVKRTHLHTASFNEDVVGPEGSHGLQTFIERHGRKLKQLQLLIPGMPFAITTVLTSHCSEIIDLHLLINDIVQPDSFLSHEKVETLTISGLREEGTYELANRFFRSLGNISIYSNLRLVYITSPGWWGNERPIDKARVEQDRTVWKDRLRERSKHKNITVADESCLWWHNMKNDDRRTDSSEEEGSEHSPWGGYGSSTWREPRASEHRACMYELGRFDIDKAVTYRYSFD